MRWVFCALLVWAGPLRACETALILMIDVSNSIDPGEYRLQVDGMADALLDAEVTEALVQGQVALAVMQWSGPDQQEISLAWAQMRAPLDVARFAAAARAMPRAFYLSDTAPAEALEAALAYFAEAPSCLRRVIDVSGDGTPNAGGDVRPLPRRAERMGVTINGIAIEAEGRSLAISGFYERVLTTRDGFTLTARGYDDYPRAIRAKILREISRVLG